MSFHSISESITTKKRFPFWERQFAQEPTESQIIFDWVFGVIAPVLSFYFDPVVFTGNLMPSLSLQSYQLFAYSVSAIEVSVLLCWLLFGGRLKRWSKLFGGVLICGSAFSAVIGVAILPLTLMGLIILIGILGFIPFFTAFVYLRVGRRALKSDESATPFSLTLGLVIGTILSLGLPALFSFYVSRTVSDSIDTILQGNPQQAQVALTRLRRMPLIPRQDLDSLIQKYQIEKDPQRKEVLKELYRQLTGEDIDHRIWIIND